MQMPNLPKLPLLAGLLDVSSDALQEDWQRLTEDGRFDFRRLGTSWMPGAWLPYLVCSVLKPDVVIETGVANGVSSYHILYALHKNGKGRLYSIDKPGHETYLHHTNKLYILKRHGRPIVDYLPPGKLTGWFVPEFLRPRWDLRLGLSSDLLPEVLSEVKTLDVFLHDSEHTYECQMMEYQAVWPYLRPGGVLISDDTHWNRAFGDFSRSVGLKGLSIYTGAHVGLLRKPKST